MGGGSVQLTMTEVPLSKASNSQLLPWRRSINGSPLCVISWCVVCTLDGINAEDKFREWVTILGHMSRHFQFKHLGNIILFVLNSLEILLLLLL